MNLELSYRSGLVYSIHKRMYFRLSSVVLLSSVCKMVLKLEELKLLNDRGLRLRWIAPFERRQNLDEITKAVWKLFSRQVKCGG